MRKGTEPVFEFTLPFDISQVKRARVIVYSPQTDVTVKKETEVLKMEGNTIVCKLTQEETFLFPCNSYVDVQLRIRDINDVPLTSSVYHEFFERCLDSEVI